MWISVKIINDRIVLSQSFGTIQEAFLGKKKIEANSNHPTAGQKALI